MPIWLAQDSTVGQVGGVGRRGLEVDDGPTGRLQSLTHLCVGRLEHLVGGVPVDRGQVAAVKLEEVDGPRGEGVGVLLEVVPAAGVAGAGLGAGVGVDPELQAAFVEVVAEPLHSVRELGGVRHEVAVGVALGRRPAVVDVDVVVAGGGEPCLDQGVRGVDEGLLGDVAAGDCPAVEDHRRRERQAVLRGGVVGLGQPSVGRAAPACLRGLGRGRLRRARRQTSCEGDGEGEGRD